MSMMTPLERVNSQFDAYNARDIERFMANFSDDVKLFRMPGATLAMEGKQALSQFYVNERFNHVGLRAELINRFVMGQKVFDHERIWGVTDTPIEMVAVFQVRDGLIDTIWSFPA
jgi:hypothetical protein